MTLLPVLFSLHSIANSFRHIVRQKRSVKPFLLAAWGPCRPCRNVVVQSKIFSLGRGTWCFEAKGGWILGFGGVGFWMAEWIGGRVDRDDYSTHSSTDCICLYICFSQYNNDHVVYNAFKSKNSITPSTPSWPSFSLLAVWKTLCHELTISILIYCMFFVHK